MTEHETCKGSFLLNGTLLYPMEQYNYKNKNDLEILYLKDKKTVREIAEICKCGVGTIHRWMVKYNIPRRVHYHRKEGYIHPNKRERIKSHGYWLIRKEDHPRANQYGYVYEQIIIAEKMLGRPLKKGEIVHHYNLDKSDNSPENLCICKDNKEHMRIHKTLMVKVSELIKKGIIKYDTS